MKIVISQPMYFPWIGMLEQIRLADVYVHYPDVSFSKGSFVNRVQIKSTQGPAWMSVPLKQVSSSQTIDQVRINNEANWRRKHSAQLDQAYARAPYRDDMLSIVNSVFREPHETLGSLSRATVSALCRYFDLESGCRFVDSPSLDVSGSGSQRVLDIVEALGGETYITGHGARHYLDHSRFEERGIRVEYMSYRKTVYPQLHGTFTPYVSALDLVANTGPAGREFIHSGTTHWKDFLQHE